jgi:hypothetical protein
MTELVRYYVQDGVSDNLLGWREPRVFVDARLHAGCELVQTLDAANWCAARAQLPL